MDKLFFVKDIEPINSNITDHNSAPSSYSHNISNVLNQTSGYLNFKGGDIRHFYATTNQSSLVPEKVYVKASFISGYPNDFNFVTRINDVKVFDKLFDRTSYDLIDGEYRRSISGYFTPSGVHLDTILRNVNTNKTLGLHDIVKISVNGSSSSISDSYKLSNLEIAYEGSTYSSNTSLTPEIHSFYPSFVYGMNYSNSSGIDLNNPDYVNGPTSSSSNDSTWIFNNNNVINSLSGYQYDISYLEFRFNTSGLNKLDKLDKCTFSVRANNSSGNNTNNKNWCKVGLFSDRIENAIGYGSGFLVDNKGGFTKLESEISFIDEGLPSLTYKNSSLMDNFFVRLYQVPQNTKISSSQIDFYTSDQNSFIMNINGNVAHKKGQILPSLKYSYNPGYNRLKRLNFDESLFDILYKPLYSGSLVGLNKQPPVWSNYYNEKIDSSINIKHDYNNYLYLEKDNFAAEIFDYSKDFTLMTYFSTSGNYTHLNSPNGATLIEKKTGSNTDFKISIEDNRLKIDIKESGSNRVEYIDSSPSSILLICGEMDNYPKRLHFYLSDHFGINKVKTIDYLNTNGGIGPVYIGGSGINDFEGYLHEYGISSKSLTEDDLLDFANSRFTITRPLQSGYPLKLYTENASKIEDDFEIQMDSLDSSPRLYQNHVSSFAYDTLVTGPENYLIEIDYKLSIPSGNNLNISGVYKESYIKDFFNEGSDRQGLNNVINFKPITLVNGSGSVLLEPYTFAKEVIKPRIDYHSYSEFDFSINSSGFIDYCDFQIDNVKMIFNGFYTNLTGIQTLSLTTDGYTFEDNSVDFYLANRNSVSGLDFYTAGRDASNKYLDFQTKGSIIQQSGVTFTTIGQKISYDDLDFYTSGPNPEQQSMEFFLQARVEPITKGVTMFMPSLYDASGYGAIYYEPYGYPYYYYFYSDGIKPNQRTEFFLKADDEKLVESINLFIEGDTNADKHLDMYLPNNQFNTNYELDFTLLSAYNQSNGLDMFISNVSGVG